MGEEAIKVGTVTHYYTNIQVGIVKVETPVEKGDKVAFKGYTTDFKQVLEDIQVNHQPVDTVEAGQEVGIKVNDKVREGDCMYLVPPNE